MVTATVGGFSRVAVQVQPAMARPMPRQVRCAAVDGPAKMPARPSARPQGGLQHAHEAVDSEGTVLTSMSRRSLVSKVGAAGLFMGPVCEICTALPAQAAGWGYADVETGGTTAWGGACTSGKQQSPVDLRLSSNPTVTTQSKSGIVIADYDHTIACTVTNTGHGTMQVTFPPGNCMSIGTQTLELVQFHFHSPSEHAVNGRRFPLEAHLVHKDLETGALAVVGVMLERGKRSDAPNPCLRQALDTAPIIVGQKVNDETTNFDPRKLLPPSASHRMSYITYAGSLTTPPCTEGITWYVMMDHVKITDDEILDFQEYSLTGAGRNARPLQPVNERKVEYKAD